MFKQTIYFLFLLFICNTLMAQCPSNTTYYVAPNGSDNNPGTVSQPFASMHHVVKVLQAGDVAIFEDGQYSEPNFVNFVNGGTVNCPITIKARNKHQAVVTFMGGDGTTHAAQSIHIIRPYIIVDGFDLSKSVKGTTTSNQLIRIYGRAEENEFGNYVTIKNNILHNAYEEGVKSYRTKGLLIENNVIYDIIHEGIDFVTVDSSIIRGNEIYDVTRMGILSGKGGSKSIQVYRNYVHVSAVMEVTKGGYGISIGGTSSLPSFPGGPVEKQLGVACYNCIVYSNLIVAENQGAIWEGLAAFGTKDCGFVNNVVIGADNGVYSRHFHNYAGNTTSPINRNDNLTIKNNIIVNSVSSTYNFWAGSLGGTQDFDHNLFFNTPNPPTESNSINADPQFVNLNSDWHLQPTSPAIDGGAAHSFVGYFGEVIDIGKDWDGLNRIVPWDMGIYEYGANPCPVMTLSTVITNESAPNANDGAIDLTPAGGALPYTFNWSNGSNTEDLNNLSGGTYQLTITDANGCETTDSATVNTNAPPGCAGGTTYYVALNGNDSNPGTLNQPFASMWKVGQVVQAGDIAIFADGNYTEPKRVDFVNGGTEDCPIILQAANQHQAKIVFTTGSQGAQSVWITKPWITIDGFDLSKQAKTNSPSNQVIRVYGNSNNSGHYCTIKNNRIHNAYGAGVKSYQTRGLLIDNNVLFDFTDDAIDLVEIDSSTISNNEVYDVQRHGIMLGGGSKSGKVFNNYVHYDGSCCMDGYGIFFGSDPEFGTIQCENSIAFNNIVTSATPGAMKGGMCMSTASDCGFYNNVIVGPEDGFFINTVPNTVFKYIAFKNNIIMNCVDKAYDGSMYTSVNPDFSHNCFHNNGISPNELNSIFTDPQFVNPLSDWTLLPTSPAIDRGTSYTFTGYYGEPIDVTGAYDGVARTTDWDMGVYESPFYTVYVKPDIRLWLEGPYNSSTNKMNTTLSYAASFPNVQPYQAPPWNYPGTEGAGWANLDYPSNTVDWVKLEFRSSTDPSSEVSSMAAVLLDDGSLYLPNVEALTINQGSAYYIVVEHRNHMAIMSPASVPVVGNSLFYDFRGSNSYAASGTGQKELGPGVWAMVAGDGDQLSDVVGYDVNVSDIIQWNQVNGSFNIYSASDFNMDGDVSALDKILWNANNGLFSGVKK